MITPRLRAMQVWQGSHRDVRFEIKRRDIGGLEDSFPSGSWSFYIYLHESACPRFSEIWLADELKEWSPGGSKHITHDYMNGLTAQVDFHGGITYYAKHGDTKGYRCAELGCDYQHYYDTGHTYDENDLARDAARAIDSCYELGIVAAKPEISP